MSPAFAQRALLLAAVTMLGAVIALAVAGRLDGAGGSDLPEAVERPGGGWYEALARPENPRVYGRPTACGHVLERSTMGFSHPVLPCGAKVYLARGGTEVLTQVVARGRAPAGVQFGLTEALARELGVERRTRIRWRFAGRR